MIFSQIEVEFCLRTVVFITFYFHLLLSEIQTVSSLVSIPLVWAVAGGSAGAHPPSWHLLPSSDLGHKHPWTRAGVRSLSCVGSAGSRAALGPHSAPLWSISEYSTGYLSDAAQLWERLEMSTFNPGIQEGIWEEVKPRRGLDCPRGCEPRTSASSSTQRGDCVVWPLRSHLLLHDLAVIPFTISKNLVNLKVFLQFKVACRAQPPQSSSGVIWDLPSLLRSWLRYLGNSLRTWHDIVCWCKIYRNPRCWFIVVVRSLSHVWLFATPWTAAWQASLSFTIS